LPENLQQILDIIKSDNPEIKFYLGVLCGILFIIFLRLFRYLIKSRKPKGVYIHGERGDTLIHQSAISDFINKTLSGRVSAQVQKVFIYTKKENHYLTVYISVTSSANVTETVKSIHDIVFAQVSEKLGIDNLVKIDIIVKDFKTKERTIEKQSQKIANQIEDKAETLEA